MKLPLALKGDVQRYTYGALALWKHAELGASNRRTAAMAAMQAVKFQGDAGQWKMQVMAASWEIYTSGVTIEHFLMGCVPAAILPMEDSASPKHDGQRHQL